MNTEKTYLYNCKRCKLGKRVEYDYSESARSFVRTAADGKRYGPGIWIDRIGGGLPTVYGGDPIGLCDGCGKKMDYSPLSATLRPEVKCNGICIHARGGSCDCSCGGANHGTGWSAAYREAA